jgi:acetyl esterase/lipase
MDPREVMSRPAAGPDVVLRYGDHPEHLLDVHLPPARGDAAPVVVFVHGGFWRQRFDRTHTRPLAQALAGDGWAVVTPEYRRTGGDGGWPATVDDVGAALEQVPRIDEVAPGRLDLSDVTLAGHSAGGHLAMWHALRADPPPGPRVRRTVALAPVADLHEAHARDLGDGAVAELMGGGPEDLPEEYDAANPVRRLPRDLAGGAGATRTAEVTVIHGDQDAQVPVDMSRGLPGVSYVELPGADHFAVIDPLSAAWPHVRDALR